MPQGHYGDYSGNHPRFSKKDDHAHTRVTDHNLHSTEKDDEAHIDYLKRDINWDDKHGHSDENMTADEKHITYLAEDEKYDEKHHSPAKFAKGVGVAAKASSLDNSFAQDEEGNSTQLFYGTNPYTETGHIDSVNSNETVQPKSNSDGGSGAMGFGSGQYNFNANNAPSAQNPQGHGKTDFMKKRIDHLEKTGSNPAKLARLQGRLERTEMRQASRADRISDRNVKKKQRVEDWQDMRNTEGGKARKAFNIIASKFGK